MSDERMIRIDNLKLLLKQEGWTQKELGLKLGFTSGAHVGKLIKKQAAFTEKTARKIEEISGRPYRWMDVVHLSGEYSDESLKEAELLRDAEDSDSSIPKKQKTPLNAGSFATIGGVVNPFDPLLPNATNPKRAPVLDWARLGVDLTRATHELAEVEFRPYYTSKEASDLCKFVRMPDDSLAPRVLAGDLILLDPQNLAPARDAITLFSTLDGSFTLMRYRPIVGGFEAYDERGRVLEYDRHGLAIKASFVVLLRENA